MSSTTDTRRSAGQTTRRLPRAKTLAVAVATSLFTVPLTLTPAAAAVPAHAPGASAPIVTTAPIGTSLQAAAVGKLGVRGCREVGTAATCDLYAMTGTTSVLGTPIDIWGFSTTGAAGSASAPGPVLAVNQGDLVTITLHNQLAQNVSLALPGQVGADFNGGDDTTGVATGGTRTYTFTADRPGTFLYEAGHTANGNRQVAMGLAGALVVLSADGSAYGSAYDDDAVVVLSEIDPALNAAPATFDLRSFRAKYRLLNGKPFPASDPISTDQGHRVMLRYVNAGLLTHPMTLLGADQTELARGGHAMAYPATVVAEAVEPGETVDALATMPPVGSPEAKLALYEANMHLDNDGQTTADPLQTAFGGMLTFLDTAAPPPSSDGVGPVSSQIKAAPNPSDGLAPVTVTADLSDATTGGSTVTQAEFVIDDAVTTGVGFGTPMTGTFGTVSVSQAAGTITTAVLAGLDAGKHQVFVRALDSAGNWGVIGSVIFNLPKTGPQTTGGSATPVPANGSVAVAISATGDDTAAGGTITDAEYFLTTVGANGSGTPLTLNRSASIVSEDASIPAATVLALGEGAQHVFVHSKDSLGLWGPTLDIPLPVDLTGPGVDAAAVGPNPSNGILSDRANPGYLVVSAQITDRDAGGGLQNAVTDAEGFLDPTTTNPPGGSGFQLIAVDGAMNSTTEAAYGLIPISQIRSLSGGNHLVSVRGKDAAGNWGALFPITLVVDKTAPVLGALAASPNPTNGAATLTLTAPLTEAVGIAAAEYWFGTVDPGVGLGTSASVSVVGGNVVVTVQLATVPPGTRPINLRVRDTAGNWSNTASVSVTVVKPNLIFSDTFDSGTLSAWSASTGGRVSVTAAAGIPAGGTNRGLQATLPGGSTNRATFVTDTSPAGETGYHAQFAFNRNTLTSGANTATALTLFDTRTPANGRVFALQYRLVGGTPQVRTVFSRSGTTPLTGAWVTLTAGAHVLQVDWTSGPATGITAGSLRLSVDGISVSLLTGNTSTLRVETARLGIVAGVTTTTTGSTAGTAYFDTFKSGRTSIP